MSLRLSFALFEELLIQHEIKDWYFLHIIFVLHCTDLYTSQNWFWTYRCSCCTWIHCSAYFIALHSAPLHCCTTLLYTTLQYAMHNSMYFTANTVYITSPPTVLNYTAICKLQIFTSLHCYFYFTELASVLHSTDLCTSKHCFLYFTKHHYVHNCTGLCTSSHNTLYVSAQL